MAKSNVTQFAEELKLPVALLLEQLQAAGVKKKAGEDSITEQDKTRLLDYLREMHGNKEEKKKITLSREFYERHEWIQRNLAERIELHRKLREQRTQQQEG